MIRLALLFWLAFFAPAFADAVSAAPPVLSVNNATGAVTVPSVQRQASAALDISSGSVTWTFPTAFTNPPTCWISLASTNTSYVFANPITTALSTTSVTVTEMAALKVLTVSLGALTVWTNPPAGTTATLSCVGALP